MTSTESQPNQNKIPLYDFETGEKIVEGKEEVVPSSTEEKENATDLTQIALLRKQIAVGLQENPYVIQFNPEVPLERVTGNNNSVFDMQRELALLTEKLRQKNIYNELTVGSPQTYPIEYPFEHAHTMADIINVILRQKTGMEKKLGATIHEIRVATAMMFLAKNKRIRTLSDTFWLRTKIIEGIGKSTIQITDFSHEEIVEACQKLGKENVEEGRWRE